MNKYILLITLLLCSVSAHAKEQVNSLEQQLIQLNTLQTINDLFPSQDDLNKQERLKQYLFLNKKTTELNWAEIDFSQETLAQYIKNTNICLYNSVHCINSNNPLYQTFYSYLTDKDKTIITNSLTKTVQQNNTQRNKIINIMLQELSKGVQEDINYNTNSNNHIREYFINSGSNEPELLSELGPYKETWAWCGAFVSSVLQQTGLSISFVLYDQYKNACSTHSQNKNYSCNPVQADFILSWAKEKNYVQQLISPNNYKNLQAGDLLLIEKNNIAQHVAFYLAQDKNYIYSLEGNVGPHINDFADYKTEYIKPLGENYFGKQYLQQFKIKNKFTTQQLERLYDRLTIVKRPKHHWDYSVNYLN